MHRKQMEFVRVGTVGTQALGPNGKVLDMGSL